MRIKKYIADNYSEALASIKKEMGSDALIMTTRSIRSGSEWNGGSASRVEITAAIDTAINDVVDVPKILEPNSTFELSDLEDEFDPDIKSLVYSLLSKTERAQSLGLKSDQFGLFSHLTKNGVSEKIISKIISKIPHCNDGVNTTSFVKTKFMETMKRVITCGGGIKSSNKGLPRKVLFVGPTGSGKTTTISKIAADLIYREKKKVALVSLDTFRVGGIEQLEIYGNIMNVPVESAQDRIGFEEVLRRHSDKDVILIDTMGRCHKDLNYSDELTQIIDGLGDVERHLVLSMVSCEKLFIESYKQFSSLGINRVLFTKLDEGLNFGSILNFSLRSRLPLSYLTTGQRVPEDIEVATQDRVIRLIFN